MNLGGVVFFSYGVDGYSEKIGQLLQFGFVVGEQLE